MGVSFLWRPIYAVAVAAQMFVAALVTVYQVLRMSRRGDTSEAGEIVGPSWRRGRYTLQDGSSDDVVSSVVDCGFQHGGSKGARMVDSNSLCDDGDVDGGRGRGQRGEGILEGFNTTIRASH